MALLTVVELGQTAFDISGAMTAADQTLDQDTFPNDERTFFAFENGSGGAITVTISKTRDTADKEGFGSLGVDDITAVTATGETWVVRVPVASHGDAAGRVTATYSADPASCKAGAFRLARH
jgi:hypothetical protein